MYQINKYVNNPFFWLSLKRGSGGCRHGFGGCEGFDGFIGFDGFGGFSGFGGHGGFGGLNSTDSKDSADSDFNLHLDSLGYF